MLIYFYTNHSVSQAQLSFQKISHLVSLTRRQVWWTTDFEQGRIGWWLVAKL